MNKKGIVGYATMVLGFVLLMIIAIAGLSVMTEMKGTFANTTLAYNASVEAETGVYKITEFGTLIGIIIAISIVIGILFTSFGGMLKGSSNM